MAVATISLFDFVTDSSDVAVPNAKVRLTFGYNAATTADGLLQPSVQEVITDSTGKFTFSKVIPNDLISPANTVYLIETPFRSYLVAPQSGNGSSQQSTAANVIVNNPLALAPYTGLTSLTVSGNLTVTGNEALTGNETVGGTLGVTGLVTASGGEVISGGTGATLNASGDLAVRSVTVSSGSGPYTPDFPGGITNQVTAGVSTALYDKAGAFVNLNGPKYRNIGTWDPVAGTGDATAAVNQAITDGIPLFPPGGNYVIAGSISNANNVPLIMLGTSVFSGAGAPVLNVLHLSVIANLYVSSTGSDSNPGTSGSPFLTIQRAADVASTFIGLGVQPTINVASGTYAGAVYGSHGRLWNYTTDGSVPPGIAVNGSWGGGTTIVTKSSLGLASFTALGPGAKIVLNNLTVQSSGHGVYAQEWGEVGIGGGVTFGACTNEHMHADFMGLIVVFGDYTISGNATAHIGFSLRGTVIYTEVNHTVTLTGSPVFSNAFAYVQDLGLLYIPSGNWTFSGAAGATTKRCYVRRGGVIETNNGSATYLPGTAIGQLVDDGRYYPMPAPTVTGLSAGWGTGATAALNAGSTDQEGTIAITIGSSPGSSGSFTFTVNFQGPNGNLVLVLTPGFGYNARAVATTSNGTATSFVVSVDNNAVALSGTVYLNYILRTF